MLIGSDVKLNSPMSLVGQALAEILQYPERARDALRVLLHLVSCSVFHAILVIDEHNSHRTYYCHSYQIHYLNVSSPQKATYFVFYTSMFMKNKWI